MIARRVPVVPALALVLALATWTVGWWSVPIIAFVVGLLLGDRRSPGLMSAGAGLLAWAGILAVEAARGAAMIPWARALGAAMQLPSAVLWGATLLLPAALAGLAASLGARLTPRGSSVARRSTPPPR